MNVRSPLALLIVALSGAGCHPKQGDVYENRLLSERYRVVCVGTGAECELAGEAIMRSDSTLMAYYTSRGVDIGAGVRRAFLYDHSADTIRGVLLQAPDPVWVPLPSVTDMSKPTELGVLLFFTMDELKNDFRLVE